jgi:hypothetical protein
MMATTIEAFLAGNPRRSFWHFQTSDFDSVSYIGIIMERIIQVDQGWFSLMSTLEESPVAQGLGNRPNIF